MDVFNFRVEVANPVMGVCTFAIGSWDFYSCQIHLCIYKPHPGIDLFHPGIGELHFGVEVLHFGKLVLYPVADLNFFSFTQRTSSTTKNN